MSEPEKREQAAFSAEPNQQEQPANGELDERIAQSMRVATSTIHFTPEMRSATLARIAQPRTSATRKPRLLAAIALLAVFIVVAGLTITLVRLLPTAAPSSATTSFSYEKTFATPNQLAHGGTLVSLDPTGQRIVYVDGGFDLFCSGHIEFLRRVVEREEELGQQSGWYEAEAVQSRKSQGKDYPPAYVVVGIHDDEVINHWKGVNYPIMNIFERLQSRSTFGQVMYSASSLYWRRGP